MGRVSTCQKNCITIDLRRAQVNNETALYRKFSVLNGTVDYPKLQGGPPFAIIKQHHSGHLL